jgi:hypothetical protein
MNTKGTNATNTNDSNTKSIHAVSDTDIHSSLCNDDPFADEFISHSKFIPTLATSHKPIPKTAGIPKPITDASSSHYNDDPFGDEFVCHSEIVPVLETSHKPIPKVNKPTTDA